MPSALFLLIFQGKYQYNCPVSCWSVKLRQVIQSRFAKESQRAGRDTGSFLFAVCVAFQPIEKPFSVSYIYLARKKWTWITPDYRWRSHWLLKLPVIDNSSKSKGHGKTWPFFMSKTSLLTSLFGMTKAVKRPLKYMLPRRWTRMWFAGGFPRRTDSNSTYQTG